MPMIGHEVECKKYLCLLGEVQRYFLYDKEDLVTLMREIYLILLSGGFQSVCQLIWAGCTAETTMDAF